MSEVLFSWLHISDIHANHGKPEHFENQLHVLRKLVEDIPRAMETVKAPQAQAIFVTGDIAFSGNSIARAGEQQSSEYARAEEWLIELASTVNLPMDKIFCVPGNHDVARTKEGKPDYHSLKVMREGGLQIDAALKDEDYKPFFDKRLGQYLKFCEKINPVCARLGSYVQTLTAQELGIRIVGLNSALLCNDDSDKGKLYLGQAQLEPLTRSATENELVIALSHHPLDSGWLGDEENIMPWVRQHAHVHLYGHVHKASSTKSQSGGSRPHIRIVAGATHGDAEPKGVPDSHGYNIAGIFREEDGRLSIRIWPRRWSPQNVDFRCDIHGVDEPKHFAEHKLDMRLPKAAAPAVHEAATALLTAATSLPGPEELAFRKLVVNVCARLPVTMPSLEPVELLLEDVYVDLKVVAEIPRGVDTFSVDERRIFAELEGAEGERKEQLWRDFEDKNYARLREYGRNPIPLAPPRSIVDVVAEGDGKALVILGDPGCGKSTLMQLLALRAARDGRLGAAGRVLAGEGNGGLLPILVRLAAYDAHLKECENAPLRAFLSRYWVTKEQFSGAEPVIERALREGRALVLLDGLDEVTSLERRDFVASQVEGLIRTAPPGNRFVITSRFVGYRQAPLSQDFEHLSMLDFGEREIEIFLRQWCEAIEKRVAEDTSELAQAAARREREELFHEIKQTPHLMELAKNPLQLSMLALLRRHHGPLPTQQVKVFDAFTRMLLESRPIKRSRGARQDRVLHCSVSTLRSHLRALALWMHQHCASRTARRQELIGQLEKECLQREAEDAQNPTRKEKARAEEHALNVLFDLREITGIVIERGHDAFGFAHLTYQEFFVAEALANSSAEQRWSILGPVLHHARWRVPLLLCAGHLGILMAKREEVEHLLTSVLEPRSEFEELLFRDAFLAVDMLSEGMELSARVLNRLAEPLHKALESKVSPVRHAAMRCIAHLARMGHRASVEWLLETLERGVRANEESEIYYSASRVMEGILDADACQPLRVWAKAQVDRYLDAWEATGNRRPMLYDRQWSLLGHFTNKDRAFCRRILGLYQQERDDATLSLHTLLSNRLKDDFEVRAEFLRRAGHSPPYQPSLMALAGNIPENEDVQALFEKYWDDPSNALWSAVLTGVVKLAPSMPQWQKRLLERLPMLVAAKDIYSLNHLAVLLAAKDQRIQAFFIPLLENSDAQLVSAAMRAMQGLLGPKREVQRAFIALLQRPEPDVRQEAITWLGPLAIGHPYISAHIQQRLEDYAPQVRFAALQALAPLALDDFHFQQVFIEKLSETDGCDPMARIAMLAPLAPDDRDIQTRIENFLSDNDPQSRVAAIQALGPLAKADKNLYLRLVQCLEDRDGAVQRAAMGALSESLKDDAALRQNFVRLCNNHELALMAIEALAPFYMEPEVRSLLIEHLDARKEVGPKAAKALAALAHQEPEILTKMQVLAEGLETLSDTEVAGALSILDGIVEQDQTVCDGIANASSNPRLRWHTLPLFCSHPKQQGVKPLLLQLVTGMDPRVRYAAIQGLANLAREDEDAKRALLDLPLEEHQLVFLLFDPRHADALLEDGEIRRRLLDVTTLAGSASFLAHHALSALATHGAHFEDVQARFLEVLNAPPSVEALRQCIRGLAFNMGQQPEFRERFLSWLGVRTPSNDPAGTTLRRTLANAFAPLVIEDRSLREKIEGMLDSLAWQERQGAAWTLIAAGLHKEEGVRQRLRDLMDNKRCEESWLERLHAASALLNHALPSLSQKAIEIACNALAYGTEPWFEPLGSQVRAQAAQVLAKLKPIYREPRLSKLISHTLENESSNNANHALYYALRELCSAQDRNPL